MPKSRLVSSCFGKHRLNESAEVSYFPCREKWKYENRRSRGGGKSAKSRCFCGISKRSGKVPRFGLFHAAAFSTALFPINSATELEIEGPHVNRSMRSMGDAETPAPGRRPAFTAKELGVSSRGAPGVSNDDMSISNSQRKHGTTRWSPRRCSWTHSEGIPYKPCR